ncbi:MAG TPA: aspartate ammonia-lyase, partial [Roseovarius nubinhibens]|nr:aspartate ammonia-lyase [Roseovarius nubinhibens]
MRQVSDSLGTLDVPEASLYGANTARGAANFKGFGPTLADYPYFMRAMAGVK